MARDVHSSGATSGGNSAVPDDDHAGSYACETRSPVRYFYENRFWVYLVAFFTGWWIDSRYTIYPATFNFPSYTATPIQGQTMVAVLLLTVLILVAISTGVLEGRYRMLQRMIEMATVCFGMWGFELFLTEVVELYQYRVPNYHSASENRPKHVYRIVPIFVPLGHYVVYDWSKLAAERVIQSFGDAIVIPTSKVTIMDIITPILPLMPLVLPAFHAIFWNGSSTFDLVLVVLLFLMVGLKTAVATHSQRRSTQGLSQYGRGRHGLATKRDLNQFLTELIVVTYSMFAMEVIASNYAHNWRWHEVWPVKCAEILESRRGVAVASGSLTEGASSASMPDSSSWYWMCLDTHDRGSSAGTLLTLASPPWLVGVGYVFLQEILTATAGKLNELIR